MASGQVSRRKKRLADRKRFKAKGLCYRCRVNRIDKTRSDCSCTECLDKFKKYYKKN